MLFSNNCAALTDVLNIGLREREDGAEDKNGNGRFYLYFASLLPRMITSIKGQASAPNIRDRTNVEYLWSNASDPSPTTPRASFQRHA